MAVDRSTLVALQRSASMLHPGQSMPVARETLHAMCIELLESRDLIERLGADLRTVAKRSRT